jgi:hypothetical protein
MQALGNRIVAFANGIRGYASAVTPDLNERGLLVHQELLRALQRDPDLNDSFGSRTKAALRPRPANYR